MINAVCCFISGVVAFCFGLFAGIVIAVLGRDEKAMCNDEELEELEGVNK